MLGELMAAGRCEVENCAQLKDVKAVHSIPKVSVNSGMRTRRGKAGELRMKDEIPVARLFNNFLKETRAGHRMAF